VTRDKQKHHSGTPDPAEDAGDRRKLLLEEYRMIGEYHRAEGTVFWQRHGQYLAVNTGLLAALALAKVEGIEAGSLVVGLVPPLLFVKGVCAIGLVASFAWIVTTAVGGWTALMYANLVRRVESELRMPVQIMHTIVPGHRLRLVLRYVFSIRVWSHALPAGYVLLWGYGLWWAFYGR